MTATRDDEIEAAEREVLAIVLAGCCEDSTLGCAVTKLKALQSPLPSRVELALRWKSADADDSLSNGQVMESVGAYWLRWVASEAAHRDTGTIHGDFLRQIDAWADELEAR